jgi:hypothetical protein
MLVSRLTRHADFEPTEVIDISGMKEDLSINGNEYT